MQPLVAPSWLASRLDDRATIILDATLPPVGVTPLVDTRARYLEKHIPGAVFFDINELSDHGTSLPHMLPTAESFSRSMSALGIGSEMTIVVYEQEGVFSAPRAWWMLRTFGARSVYILDGGLRGWVEAGFPLVSGMVERAPAEFAASPDRDAVQEFAQVQQVLTGRLEGRVQILDARSAGRFAGTSPEPRAGLRSGHMPGSTSVPFTDLVEDGRLKPAGKLREIFADKQVDLDEPITTTCGSGVTAAVVLLALEIAGAKQVALYDGSWAEYAQRAEAEIVADK
jgi:thiosulfate/3-mercaptopyruvate sulfurtransferase